MGSTFEANNLDIPKRHLSRLTSCLPGLDQANYYLVFKSSYSEFLITSSLSQFSDRKITRCLTNFRRNFNSFLSLQPSQFFSTGGKTFRMVAYKSYQHVGYHPLRMELRICKNQGLYKSWVGIVVQKFWSIYLGKVWCSGICPVASVLFQRHFDEPLLRRQLCQCVENLWDF